MRSVHTHANNGVPNNNNNNTPHSGELKHAIPQAGGPTQSQLSRPMSSGHHISMEHRLRRKQLNSDTNARKQKHKDFFFLKKKGKKRRTRSKKKKKKKEKGGKKWRKKKGGKEKEKRPQRGTSRDRPKNCFFISNV